MMSSLSSTEMSVQGTRFCLQNPLLARKILKFAVCGALGQVCDWDLIHWYGGAWLALMDKIRTSWDSQYATNLSVLIIPTWSFVHQPSKRWKKVTTEAKATFCSQAVCNRRRKFLVQNLRVRPVLVTQRQCFKQLLDASCLGRRML